MSLPLQQFVAQHRGAWQTLEGLLDRLGPGKGSVSLTELEGLDRLYRQAAADLAVAQIAYPRTDAHRFLNALCSRAYGVIYQPPTDRWVRVRRFYREGFPRMLRANASYLWVSLALFLLGIALGAVVVALEPQGAQLLVPQNLRDSVARHEMWTDNLLSVAPPGFHASAIATNNLTVTILVFASGLLLGLGSAFLMITNGLLIGAVAALCIQSGMGGALFAFIGAHGPVELTSIVISGAAGLMMGHALLEPGESTRGERLRVRARDGVQLLVGTAPFLACIALVEGFVSPGSLFGAQLKLALGLLLGVCYWTYLALAGRAGTWANRSARRSAR